MADRNLVLSLLITAKDQASAVLSKLYSWLNDATNVTAGLVREAFTNLFSGGVESAAEFEKTLDAVAAKGNYTRKEMTRLTQAADQLGAQFGMAGGEVAKGMEILAAAGLSARDVIATLPPVLNLAALEGISLDVASTKLADSLSIMGLGFEHAGRMADVLAKGAGITLSSATQLADALTIAGGAATSYGLSLEQTVAALDLLHKNGIKGSEAGTAFKTVLLQLLDPTSAASKAIAALRGDASDFESVLRVLTPQTATTQAAILKFGAEATPALFALRKEGVAGMTEFTSALRNAAGSAEDASATMSGNLKGALEALAGAWDALKRNLLTPLLEPLAQAAQTLTDRLNNLAQSAGIRQFGEVLAAVAQTSLQWLERLSSEGLAALQRFTGGLSFAAIAQKVADAKKNLTSLISAGLDAAAAKFREVAAGMVQTTTQLVVDIKTGLIGLLDGIRQLPIVQGEAFDRLSASIRALRQGLPELAAVAKTAGEQSAQGQAQYNAALARTQQAYADLQAGVGDYERSVREGAQRMGLSEQDYIAYLREHGVELQKLIPLELERVQATTKAQSDLLQQTQKTNQAQQKSVNIAKILTAAGVDELEIKRLEALAAGNLTEALRIESEQRRQAAQQTQENAAASEAAAMAKEKEAAAAKQAAEAQAAAAAAEQEHAEQLAAQGNLVSGVLNNWQERLQALSPAALQAFRDLRNMSAGWDENASAADNYSKALEALGQTTTTLGGTGLVRWMNETAYAAQEVEARFWGQAVAAERLTEQLTAMAEGGRISLFALQDAQHRVQGGFDLLDQTRLDNLQRAIDAATQKMETLRQASLDALDAAQRALLQEQDDQAALARLDFERTKLDLQNQINAARAAGDAEAIANLQKALNLETQAYELKLKKINATEKETAQTSTSTAPASSRGGTSGGITLNVNAPNARFLDGKLVEELARQITPVLTTINRRLS